AKELEELKKLEQEMQRAVRNMQGTDRQTSTRMRDALGNMQQEELPLRMQWSEQMMRRGMGQYAVMREPVVTQALNHLRDQLKDEQRGMAAGQNGKDDKDGKGGDKAMEQALANVEKMRRQLEQMRQGQNGQQQGNQRGQQQGQGQQTGNQQGQGQPQG